MATVKAKGPIGALLALGNLDVELHNVRQRSFRSGKIVSNGMGYGETKKSLYYINGNHCTRKDALSRLSKFIGPDEIIEISGPLK